ncbi:MAG: hypothetical protein LBL79_01525 [Prevotella sp.]|jgi:hypothetical protein|nr:hypothetical protein [Prevotella sp.]
MTTLEIKKKEFLKAIDNEETLDKLQKYLSRLKAKNTQPCKYSVEEVKRRIEQGIVDAEHGKGVSIQEMRKRYTQV